MPAPPPLLRRYRLSTPWGTWQAAFSEAGLRELRFPASRLTRPRLPSPAELNGQEGELGRRLRRALEGRLRGHGADLPWEAFDLRGCPPFYLRAWKALYRIPRGEVRTYRQLARAAGSPKAVRAAGQACGANPIALFIPCHRVVAAQGLGGFGAGLGWKKRLLMLERV